MSEAVRAIAINYHFVRDASPGRFRLRAHERTERFDAQLGELAGRFPFLRCRDLFASQPAPTGVLITFDDGARDVFEQALPVLRRHGATATAFVCSKPYLEGRLLQIQKVEYLISELGLPRFRDAFYAELERRFPAGVERESLAFAGGYAFYRYDDEPTRRFKLDLNYQLPYPVVEPVLDALFEGVFGPGSEAEAVRETYMSVDQLRRLADAGVEIGSHAHAHRVLPRLDFALQKREMEISVGFLKEITGDSRISLAYPFSFHDQDTKRAADELDLLAGFAGERRPITDPDIRARWSVPRYDVNECFDRSSNALRGDLFAGLVAS
jgi:peptidoglycan/xylan/chitin deacetylase (PgdA/CDA1 family)